MEILKDIEKNILNINIFDKFNNKNNDPLNNANMQKLDAIKKQINEYFKNKDNEKNIILQKKLKYDDDYKFAREINNNNYNLFLEKKAELYNIFKKTKTLASLYDYLDCKYTVLNEVPDIYTYEYINLNERAIIPSANVCPSGKILNKKTKKCVKDPQDKVKKVVDKDKVKKVVDKDKEKKVVDKDKVKKVVDKDKVKKVVDKDKVKKVVDKDKVKKVVDKDKVKKVVDKDKVKKVVDKDKVKKVVDKE
jgi:hypothetical protein